MNKLFNNFMGHAVAQWLGHHRREWLCRQLGETSYYLWRAYENRNFNMHTNGEEWLLHRLKVHRGIQTAFDVGANVGDWLTLCHYHHPRAFIHAFEIAPPTFLKLSRNAAGIEGVRLNAFGLSDQEGEIEIFYNPTQDGTTSAYAETFGAEFEAFGRSSKGVTNTLTKLQSKVVIGDKYVEQNKIEVIDFLKIDVEGMEQSVLRGFIETFRQKKIQLVQFEYNVHNIATKFLLRDAYQFFDGIGYQVGKLYPNLRRIQRISLSP